MTQARELTAVLRSRAAWTDEHALLHPDTVKDLAASDLYRVLQPERYGGLELDLTTLIDVAAELAQGCASTAWVWGNLASHHLWVGTVPERLQREIWGERNDVLVASATAPGRSRARTVDGRYRLSGRWSYSSGVELSGWNVLATGLADDPDQLRWFAVVPQHQYRVVGDWDVTGLRGTNSKDIEVDDDLFVPAHRFFSEKTWHGGETPGSATNPAAIFRLPLMDVGPYALTGVALGLARRALELAVEFVTSQKSRSAGAALSGLQLTIGKIARARHLVDVSEVTMKHWAGIAGANAIEATPLSATDRVSYRSHAALSVKFALEAINVLVPVYGARILARGSEIERILRDANAIRSNMAFNLEVDEQAYGSSLLQPAP